MEIEKFGVFGEEDVIDNNSWRKFSVKCDSQTGEVYFYRKQDFFNLFLLNESTFKKIKHQLKQKNTIFRSALGYNISNFVFNKQPQQVTVHTTENQDTETDPSRLIQVKQV